MKKWLLIIILFFSLFPDAFSDSYEYQFDHIDLSSSLQGKKVNCLMRDKKGFLWVGLTNGIIRYDGYNAEKINAISSTGEFLDFGHVLALIEDTQGMIWVGTMNGLFIYDPDIEVSRKINDKHLAEEHCRVLLETSNREIVVGTNNGLRIIDRKSNEVNTIVHYEGNENGLSNNIVRSLYEDSEGNLWVGTYDQLNSFDNKSNVFRHFRLRENNRDVNNLILSIEPYSSNNDSLLWVGTETGLCLFNRKNGEYKVFRHKGKENSLSNDVVKSITLVDNENIWLGTDYGLNIFDHKKGSFSSYLYDYQNTYSISNNTVTAIFKDQNGYVWLGTDNGLDKTYIPRWPFLWNKVVPDAKSMRKGMVINDFAFDENGDVWIASMEGIVKYDSKMNRYSYFQPPQVLHSKVKAVHADQKGKVWFATSGGLNVFDLQEQKFYEYTVERSGVDGLKTNYIYAVEEDLGGEIWISGYKQGLYKVVADDYPDLKFINFKSEPDNDLSLSSDIINDIQNDSLGRLLLATTNGINRFDPVKGVFNRFFITDQESGPSIDFVSQVIPLEGDDFFALAGGNIYKYNAGLKRFETVVDINENIICFAVYNKELWFSTPNLICSYDPKTEKLLKFSSRETHIQTFNGGVFSDDSGRIFFGGFEGFVSFNPELINVKIRPAKVSFTNFRISGQSVKPGKKGEKGEILNKSIDNTERIVLDYKDNTFSIEFSTLGFDDHKSVSFSYILDDYEKQWQIVGGGKNYASYTRVKPGTYQFKVKATNDYGVFNDESRVIEIKVMPPVWASPAALFIYLTILVFLFILSRRMLIARMKYRNEIRLERMEREKSDELYNIKIRFFTNISHELRTPLTLILSPLEQLLKQEKESGKLKVLNTIKKNADRLLKMVNQVLDLRKIDSGADKLRIQYSDFLMVVKKVVDDFGAISEKKEIRLSYGSDHELLMMWFDLEKVEKILYNLISNAVKFTSSGGVVRVRVKRNEEQVILSVSDTGPGIPEKYQSEIFDRFVNVKINDENVQQGSGIGLSLVRSFTEQHNGTVRFVSKANEGTTFFVSFPYNKSLLPSHELMENKEEIVDLDEEDSAAEIEPAADMGNQVNKEDGKTPTVLVVEDDPDMQSFIADALKSKYTVLVEDDGKKGWARAIKVIPNMIVSDVMMPEMDGVKLCEKLKGDIRTSHIPVILLTAKTGMENKMEGILHGADDYIEKPFRLDFLLLRIQKLIEQRSRLREVFMARNAIEPSEIEVGSIDRHFLEKLVKTIEDDIDNPELNVRVLSEKVGVSHTNLYRKIKGLTGLTATEFIRTIRLKRAAQLLKNKELNVTDVMYMVGFSHRSYFTRSFKEFFGVAPRDYK